MNQWIGTLSVKVYIDMFLGVFETYDNVQATSLQERFLDFFFLGREETLAESFT